MGHNAPRTPLLLALALLSLLAFAPAASADQVICEPGPGAGQCESPRGIAVDTSSGEPESGRVYVADRSNNRVDVFDEPGAFLFAFGWKVNATTPEEKLQTCTTASGCLKGTAGAGAGQLGRPESITVDSSSHDVYVSEDVNHRVQKFDSEGHFVWMAGGEVDTVTHANLCTVAANCGAGKAAEKAAGKEEGRFFETLGVGLQVSIGPGGTLYVADSRKIGTEESEDFETRVQRFEPSGTYIGPQLILPDKVGRVEAFTVDSGGNIYAATTLKNPNATGVRKYDSGGTPVTSWGESGKVDTTGGAIPAIALDPAGDLFAGNRTISGKGVFDSIFEYNASGAKNRVFFGNGTFKAIVALAFHHTATGDLYAAERVDDPPRVVQFALPPPGPLFVPRSTEASPVGSVKATLRTEFNSEGKASKAHFQYVDKHSFETEGGFASPNTQTTPDSPPTPADFENHEASATNVCAVPTEPSCLKPETTYYFRAIASNSEGDVEGEKAEFTTRPPLEIGATWATEVGTDSARLHGEVNPLGVHATGHFQYIPEGPDYQAHGFEHALDSPNLDFGAGEAPIAAATQLFPLQPDTTYHYRLVASDPYFPQVTSPERTFTTFSLPTPGEGGPCPNQAFRTGPSAALPDCRAYELVTPLDKNNGDILTRINNTDYPTDLDQSSEEGSGFAYSSYRAFAEPESAPYTNQYLARRDPEAGWGSEALDPPRRGRFRDEFENEYKAFSADLSQAWMLQEGEPTLDPCAPLGFADLYRRDSASGAFAALSCAHPSLAADQFMPELEGFSADSSHAVFRIDDALTADASGAMTNPTGGALRPIYQVYESTGVGELHLLSVLPGGEASAADSSAGTALNSEVVNHNRLQIVDGAVSADGTRVFWSTGLGPGPIYLRINADQAQSKVSAGKCTQPAKACTIAVSGTVSAAGARFQAANPQGTKALFAFTEGPLKDNLYEFDANAEPPASELIAEGLGDSKVSYNILGASEDLSRVYYASEEASAQAQSEGAVKGKPNVYLAEEGAARFVGTLSDEGDNPDLVNNFGSPIATTPIERTARVSPDGQSLVFMSNSPALSERTAGYDNTDVASGQPDDEVYLYDATANEGNGKLRCVSCNPSGARPSGRQVEKGNNGTVGPWAAAAIPRPESELYQPRYLSDDGRRVFFDSFDALVLGDTNGKEDAYQWEAAGIGGCKAESPSYVPASEGCLSLLSSGQSPFDSEFLDANPDGHDAFFTTAEGLLPQDYGLVDAYDARVNGGFPAPTGAPAPCEGEACQGSPQAPNDPTPASAADEGAGNVVEKPARKKKHHKANKRHHKRAHRNRRTHR